MDENEIALFLKAIHGHRFESIFLTTLFTGLREGEVLGLTWDCIDFDRGILLINKQLQLHQEAGIDAYKLVSPKNGKSRSVAAAPSVIACLKRHKSIQAEMQIKAGSAWHNPDNLVFTDELGGHLTKSAVYRAFKSAVQSIGRAGRKILCKRFSTKSRMALESRADSGLNPLITESHGSQNGMRAGTA